MTYLRGNAAVVVRTGIETWEFGILQEAYDEVSSAKAAATADGRG
jgi:hypothetical protein